MGVHTVSPRWIFLTVLILSLCVASTGLLITRSVSMPEAQSTPDDTSIPEAPSIPEAQPTLETPTTKETVLGTTFTMLPEIIGVYVNDTFLVAIFAENVMDMYGWQIHLCFDSTIVECINVSIPDQHVFLDNYSVSQALIDYNSTEFTKRPLQAIENDKGYVMAADCLLGQNQPTFNGSGFLCQVMLKAISSGSSNLTLYMRENEGTLCLDEKLECTMPTVFNSCVIVRAHAGAKPIFYIVPEEVVVNVGYAFSVRIFALFVTDMYGWQTILKFDPTIIECLDVSVSDRHVYSNMYTVSEALIDYNNTEFTTIPVQVIMNDEGWVLAGDCLLGRDQPTFSGSGMLCQIDFKAISSGNPNLEFSLYDKHGADTFLLDSKIEQIVPTISNSRVIVY